ncbi:DsrE family protein [Roseivivax sp. CAU 1761]
MSRILVHIHTGAHDRNKCTLGCLVAATAAQEGHDVDVFFAGDGVHCLSTRSSDVEGQGTGRIGDHIEAIASAGAAVYVSGKSAKARGYGDDLLDRCRGSFAMPDKLVSLALQADTVLCY